MLQPINTAKRRSTSRSRSRARIYGLGHSRSNSSLIQSPAQEFLSSLSRREELSNSLSSLPDDSLEGLEVHGWKLGKTIGIGAFSIVKECTHVESGEKAAVKIVRQHDEDEQDSFIETDRQGRPRGFSTPQLPLPSFYMAIDELEGAEAERYETFVNRETKIWSKLALHPHILPLLGVYTQESLTCVFMPLCTGGNLLEYIQDFTPEPSSPSESRGRDISRRGSLRSYSSSLPPKPKGLPMYLIRHIFKQVAAGISHLHASGVTHRDIKLENILLDAQGQFRIADFGLAYVSSSQTHPLREFSEPLSYNDNFTEIMNDVSPAGSLNYCPPEQLSRHQSVASPSVDIWALGCVLYALIDGNLPFFDDFEPRLRIKIMKGKWQMPRRLAVNEAQGAALLQVLKGCLDVELDKRWSIQRILESEWLTRDWPDGEPSCIPFSTNKPKSRSRSRGRQLEATSKAPRSTSRKLRKSRSRSLDSNSLDARFGEQRKSRSR